MALKPLVIFTVLSFFCQIIFSIYYSTAIVDQNILVNAQLSDLGRLTINQQQLEIKLSTLNSLSHILNYTQNKTYTPVTSTVDLH